MAELLKKASASGKSQTVHISTNEFHQAAELRKHGGVGPQLGHVEIFGDLKQPRWLVKQKQNGIRRIDSCLSPPGPWSTPSRIEFVLGSKRVLFWFVQLSLCCSVTDNRARVDAHTPFHRGTLVPRTGRTPRCSYPLEAFVSTHLAFFRSRVRLRYSSCCTIRGIPVTKWISGFMG
jgi:hypothetical protein